MRLLIILLLLSTSAYAHDGYIVTNTTDDGCSEDFPCTNIREYETTWVGYPMISNNDPYYPSQGWLSETLIGLREDGVVVWKSIKEPK